MPDKSSEDFRKMDLLGFKLLNSSLVQSSSKGYPFKNISDFTTAGDWNSVAGLEGLPAFHYSVDFIFLSFGIMGFIVEL